MEPANKPHQRTNIDQQVHLSEGSQAGDVIGAVGGDLVKRNKVVISIGGGIGALLLLIAAFAIILLKGGIPVVIASPAPAFPHASEGEILIVIARYAGALRAYQVFPERYVRDALLRRGDLLRQNGYNIRVEDWDQEITTSRDARSLGQKYGATLVVWGEFDDVGGIHTFVEILSDIAAPQQEQAGEWLSFQPLLSNSETVNLTRQCIVSGNPSQANYLVLLSLGIISISQNELNYAQSDLSDAIGVAPSNGCEFDTNIAYFWRGITETRLEEYEAAVSDFDVAQSHGMSTAQLYGARGIARFITGDTQGALDDLTKSYDLLGNAPGRELSIATGNLGLVYEFLGKTDSAAELYQKALDLDTSLSDSYGMAWDYGWIGNLNLRRSEFSSALKYYTLAVQKYHAAGYKKGEAAMTGNLGVVYESEGELKQAQSAYTVARQLNTAIGDKQGLALDYLYAGNLAYKTGDFAQALEEYQAAITMCASISYRVCTAVATGNTGLVFLREGDYDAAVSRFLSAQALHQEIRYEYGVARQLIYLGAAHGSVGDYQSALGSYEQACQLYEEMGSRKGQADCLLGIGIVEVKENRVDEAKTKLNQALELYVAMGYVQEAKAVADALHQVGN